MRLPPYFRQVPAALPSFGLGCARLRNIAICALLLLACVRPSVAGETSGAKTQVREHLIFCNEPEQLRMPGACADSLLQSGHTYTIFYHFRNLTRSGGPFVVALHGDPGKPFRFTVRQGMADPQRDPPMAGRQAMARYLSAPDRDMYGRGGARFSCSLAPRQVVSGIMTVHCDSDARLRIYFLHDKWTVPHSGVIVVDAPRREYNIKLKSTDDRPSVRIGDPEPGMHPKLDGTYGMLYTFHISAPPGRRVRVSFSPRGGKGGLVGSMNGSLRLSPIVHATGWEVLCECQTDHTGTANLTTAPFGGVFYPVELVFRIL